MIDHERKNSYDTAAPFMNLRERSMSDDQTNPQRAGSTKVRRPMPRKKREQILREAVEPLTHLAGLSAVGEEKAEVFNAAYTALCVNAGLPPGPDPRVTWRLHERGISEKCSIDHWECGKYHVDYAWPIKRIGIHLHSRLPDWNRNNAFEHFGTTDGLLRERGWLIFPVYQASANFGEQIDRVVPVVKRMGPYPGMAS
jgi:hypothetical protein